MNTVPHIFRALAVCTAVLCVQASRAQDQQWKNTIFGSIEKKQYEFSPNKGGYITTNRASDFRITVLPLTQHIEHRTDPAVFAYDMELTGIRQGQYQVPLMDQPAYKVGQHKITEQHSHFSIEYINNTDGLRQNFIVPQKISNTNALSVELKIKSATGITPALENNEVVFYNNSQKTITRYNSLKVFDAHGTVFPAVFSVDGQNIGIHVNTEGAVYPITVDPLSNTPNTQVTGTQAQMQMGYCVSGAGDVNGDGYSDVIVGAWKYDNVEINEGAAFVYLGSASGLSTTPAWSAEANQTGAEFGVNVSDAGDVNGDGYGDVIVGAHKYSNGQYQEGRAYVYHGSSTGLSSTANWTFESNQDTAALGFIVSTAGDINGDGFSDVVVGASEYNNGQVNEGVAYVFHGSATGLPATANNMLEQNQAQSRFGWSVSSAGDVNNDGFADIIISASYFDNGQRDEGKAWVYAGSASGLNTTPIWTHESNIIDAYYGENVSWAGDVNGDGYGDIVVGADYATNGQSEEGLVYVYHGSASGPGATASIILERNIAGMAFGVGVNGAGDVNGDGYGDLIVGAYLHTNGQTFEGTAFVYYGSSTGLSNSLFTLLEANQANAAYGISVCSAGDVNGDGFSDVIVGAYQYDQVTPSAVNNGGAFFVYHGQPERIGTAAVTNFPYTLTQAAAGLGNFVTCVGDVNRDGFSDIAVGASLFDNSAANRGVVYIFHGSATGYAAAPNTTIDGPNFANANFGASIGAAGDVNGDGYSDIIVGAPGLTNPQSNEGGFYIYLGGASGVSTTAHLGVEANLASAALGFSVSGAGDVNGDGYSDVIVGANGYTNGQTNEGRTYVYYGSASGVDATPDWQYETNVVSERMGACVAGVGDATGDGYSDVVILSSGFSNGQTNEGRFMFFTGSDTGLTVTPVNTFETNVASAGINNQSCSFVGDINGDGFNEVLIGISSFNSGGTANEGVLRIYYGATPNLNFSTIQNVEGNATSFLLGATVGFGGDVNGDGYNDVISGSPTFNNAATANEGIARVYLGGATGLATTPTYSLELNMTGYSIGSSVSAAGDINGDGYSDIIIGAKDYDAGAAPLDVGRVYAFYGNNSHGIKPMTMLTRQYKSDMTTPVQTSNGTFQADCNFGIGHLQKAHLGRGRAKLLYEVRGHPHPFSNAASAMGTSVSQSGIQGSFTNLALTGSTLTMGASSIPPMGFPKWRTRVRYNHIDAIDGQIYGRWWYGGIHDKQDRSIKVSKTTCGILPITLQNYLVDCNAGSIALSWQMGSEENIARYTVFVSTDGETFEKVKTLDAREAGAYQVELENNGQIKLVKLQVLDNNLFEHDAFTAVVNCVLETSADLGLFPNPSNGILHVSLNGWSSDMGEITGTTVIDLNGKQVYTSQGYVPTIDLSGLTPGFYYISLLTDKGKKFSARFVRM